MRYDYLCEGCGRVTEVTCPMAERPAQLDCQCGAVARQAILTVPQSFVRNRPYEFKADKTVRHFGHRFGRTEQQQHEGYRQRLDAQRKHVKQRKRSLSKESKNGFEYLGGAPMEMVHAVGRHEGDPEAFHKDPVTFLKKNDLYFGEE